MLSLARFEVDPDSVTPGVIGFVVSFVLIAAVLLLLFDMARRIRRVRYREEVRAKLDAEAAAGEATGAAGGGEAGSEEG